MEEKHKTVLSKILKAGGRTFFFDVKEAKNGKNYLIITESRFHKDTKQSTRSSVFLFQDDIEKFKEILQEIELA